MSIVIHATNDLNLAEVMVFNGQTQLTRSSLTFTLSSTHSVAGNCNDGNLNNFCHTIEGGSDTVITLTIGTGYQYFDQIVVYNRNDCCWDRINGGTIKVIGASTGTEYKSWTFNTAALTFTFSLGAYNL